MKERTQKKEYCRPQAEILGMDSEVSLLNASGTKENLNEFTGSRSNGSYDEMVDLDQQTNP